MVAAGKRARQRLIAEGRESETGYGRHLFKAMGDRYQKALERAVGQWAMKPEAAGPHYCAMPLLLHFSAKGMAPVAATALKVVLNQISRRRRVESVASAIGRAVEDEARATAMHARSEAAARLIQKAEGPAGLVRPETLADFQLEPGRWDRRDRYELGMLLLSLLMAETRGSLLEAEPGRPSGYWLCAGQTARLEAESDREAVEAGLHVKCPMPDFSPSDWIKDDGLAPHVRRRDGGATDYLKGLSLPVQAKALNTLNRTPLYLDPFMVETVRWAWEKGIDVFPCPPPATDADVARARNRWVAERERRQQAHGQLKVDDTIEMMSRQAEHGRTLYLDHCLDFRGRIYTCSGPISYQGPDYVKGTLFFAAGGLSAARFCVDMALEAAAGHWGHGLQRVTWAERLRWGQENLGMIKMCGLDPKRQQHWAEAESPFQFLQACRALAAELEGAELKTGPSSLPVRYDQTCSGVGHAAALLEDVRLMRLTNMIGEERCDVYEEVAQSVARALTTDLQMNPARCRMASMWLEVGVDRSLLKRPVMSAVYGARHFSIRDYLAEHLLSQVTLSRPSDYQQLVTNPASYLARIVLDVMKQELSGVFRLQAWMKSVVSCVTKKGREVSWVMNSGFRVKLWSHRPAVAPVRTHLSGSQGWWTDDSEARGEEFSARASGPGATANLIHSLDAALVHSVLGVASGPILATHDCFAVPCDDLPRSRGLGILGETLAREMASLYSSYSLTELHWDVARGAGLQLGDLPEPPLPQSGDYWRGWGALGSNPYLFS